MAMGSLLWKVARLAVSTGVAETAAERLVERVRTIVTAPRPAPPPREAARDGRPAGSAHVEAQLARQQLRIDTLEAMLRDQDGKLTALASSFEKFGNDVRPLILRSAITFWAALLGLGLALAALVLALVR